jgi:CHAT domain-containing protein/tetratricopeptide (TPR) repeat protein
MRYWRCIILFVVIGNTTLAQTDKSPRNVFDSTTQVLKSANDVTGFTYAFVDQFLAQPNEANLSLFYRYEKQLWRAAGTNDEKIAYVILLCNKGYYLTRYDEIHKAIDAYEKAWRIFDNNHLNGFDVIEYCLKPLANNYSMLGDYSSAGNIVKNYLFLSQQQKDNEQILSALINLAIIFHDTGKSSEAVDLLQQALALKSSSLEKVGLIYAGLASNYERLSDHVKANDFASKAISALQQNPRRDVAVHLVNVYKLKAVLSMHENNMDAALQFIKSAQRIAALNKSVLQNRDLAKLNNSYAAILSWRKQHDRALKSYQHTLAILLPKYNPSTANTLPDASSLYAENAIKETFDGMADVYLQMNQPEQALACYELSFITEDLLRRAYNYDDAKFQQQLENRRRTEKALNILYGLYTQTNGNEFLIRAFQLAERTKAIMLRENIDNRFGRKTIQDDSLIKQEQTLLRKQAKITNDIVLEQLKHEVADISRINELLATQTKTAMLLKDIGKAIHRKFPDLVASDDRSLDLPILQNKLKHDHSILMEYFIGEESVFVFVISASSIEFKKIDDIAGVRNNIIALNELFSTPSAINNEIGRYKELAFQLYVKLKLPMVSTERNLILIPDGLLAVIPFDALLYEKSEGTQYKTFPYLIKKFSIAYQPSAFIYANSISKLNPIDKERLLAMFPVFENTNHALSYSMEEAEGIHKHMDGKYLYKQAATMNAFLNNGNEYSIIHLSTHATAGDGSQPPSISFIDSTLYLPQIYGLQVNADLLVLSACETGSGLLVKGEGAISLARGFQFAGVKNIVFSLWRVNDYSTASLMINFYQNYIKTGSKADGLRLAKVDYLNDNETSNSHKSPYYWAGFVYYGDVETQAVDNSWFIVKIILIIIVAIISIAAVYVLRRKYS